MQDIGAPVGQPGPSRSRFGHASKPSNSDTGFSHGAFASNLNSFADRHPRRVNVPAINTQNVAQGVPVTTTAAASATATTAAEMSTPGTAYDMQFTTSLLPSQLLLGSPFQPGTPAAFATSQFQGQLGYQQAQQLQQVQQLQQAQQAQQIAQHLAQQQANGPLSGGGVSLNGQQHNGGQQLHGQLSGGQLNGQAANGGQQSPDPQTYQTLVSPSAYGAPQFFGPQSPGSGYNGMGGAPLQVPLQATSPVAMSPSGPVGGASRTVYLGNIPADTPAEELLSHVRSGQIESVRMLPDKNCAFISFLDASSATHFHSDAILKKLCIKGQDVKVGWGKPSQVPTSVALAVQQSGASRNVYLGNLPEEITEEELREDLGKFGAIDTIKLVREKNIAFIHFLSIANAIKAVTQLPQEPKWQSPRRVYYGKDRCAYVSKTQQQNAAQYLGIAPGYAHMLTGADRDVISNALAQQSVAAAAVATTAGGISNLGNRTIYLGNIHPETTIEEICNVVRGGLLHHVRYIPDKHICFVTFIDPTAAASFYALSNLQGLMIHNRRLKIGWGKHSGALPAAIALAVSGGASRNVYIGNLDETWTEERLRQDFSEYGEIELVNTLREKSCAFVNFANIANAIKAIEAIRSKEEYKKFKVNFGKDRCGNAPRQLQATQSQQQQQQQGQGQGQGQGQQGQQQLSQQNGGGAQSPSVENGRMASPPPNGSTSQNSGSPTNATSPANVQPAVTLFNTTNNALTMYLSHVSQQAAQQQQQQHQQQHQQQQQQQQQQHMYGGANNGASELTLEVPQGPIINGHQQSASMSNGYASNGAAAANGTTTTIGGLLAPGNPRGQHNRAVSLPVLAPGFKNGSNSSGAGDAEQQQQQQQRRGHQYQASFGGGFGLAIQGGLSGWVEEEVPN